jgi:hypothetical protein
MDALEFTGGDGFSYSINLFHSGGVEVAVIFRVQKGKLAEATPLIELSLQTLAVGDAAAAARQALARRPKPPPKH